MGNWQVRIEPQTESLVFKDTRRQTGRAILRPIFLQHLARGGEIVRREIKVTDPEGKPKYSDTFLVICLRDELGEVTMLFEHCIDLGIRMVGVIDGARRAQKILEHLQQIVKTENHKELKIILPPTYRLNFRNQ
ncbi:MAG: hypothetical protein KIH08_12400 [Candidatus Freyarchaeota archaeon]|nr:hypothetical protein [Candidatus Jordarchaeia archaeon]